MKLLSRLLPLVLLTVGVSALTSYLLRPGPQARAADPPPAVARPSGTERELAERLGLLEARIAELAARPVFSSPDARTVPDELERTVRRLLAEERSALAEPAAQPAEPAAGSAERALPRETAALLALLEDPARPEMEGQLLWERVRAAGRIEEVLSSYEALAQARPDDPEAQVRLGNAYLQKLFQLGDGPLKGMVALQADTAFDRALELDPGNWEARFTKAVSLSHWPPIFGKQSEAIAHFETLVQQQRNLTPSPEHAHTYLLLGNLYLQTGKLPQAHATWQEGLGSFPGHAALLDAVAKN